MHERLALAAIVVGCGGGATTPDAAPAGGGADASPVACLEGAGRHRLFVQGHQGARRPDGRHPLLHDHRLCDDAVFVEDTSGDGLWQPGEEPRPLGPDGLVHGEHFLVGAGAFVELAIDLCVDLGPDLALYIPNYDEAGSRTLHQVVAVDVVIAEAIDEEAGQSGYNPFVRVLTGDDPATGRGDVLLLRSINLSGVPFSVMVWAPPSEYESWIVVEAR